MQALVVNTRAMQGRVAAGLMVPGLPLDACRCRQTSGHGKRPCLHRFECEPRQKPSGAFGSLACMTSSWPGGYVSLEGRSIRAARLFSGHSLRAGLALSAEIDERCVQQHLGHARTLS
ncbi:MAG: hypothetical protein F4Y57_06945 [Acidobacteria bacterium]|nr:hypothetical protein [Acidobacteriota bacterium]